MGGMSATISNGSWAYCNGPTGTPQEFSPDTDANDDYAVLEWMRGNLDPVENEHGILLEPWAIQLECPQLEYEVGDYARAALKVLDHE